MRSGQSSSSLRESTSASSSWELEAIEAEFETDPCVITRWRMSLSSSTWSVPHPLRAGGSRGEVGGTSAAGGTWGGGSSRDELRGSLEDGSGREFLKYS